MKMILMKIGKKGIHFYCHCFVFFEMIHKYIFVMFFCFVLFCFICFLSLRYYKIVTSNENYSTVLSKLRDEGVNFEPDNGSELLPLTTVEVANLCSVLFSSVP